MKRHAQKAVTELKAINAPVYDHLEGERGVHFIIGGELRTGDDQYFADYYQEQVWEHVDDSGKIVNAFGVRQDVIDILDKYSLFSEWINPAQLGVWDS